MKKLYTYAMAGLLTVSVLLASAGVPLFAHMCNMGCETEVSLMEDQSCCEESCPVEKRDKGISKPSCCQEQALFLKKELPGLLSAKSILPFLPEITLYHSEAIIREVEYTPASPQENSPPLPSGRLLLNKIHILRT